VSDTNDIVTNLRSASRFDCAGGLVERAADEIDRLRAEVNDLFAAVAALKAEVAQRTAERDEARRELCLLRAPSTQLSDIAAYAIRRNWDCCDAPHANTTDVGVQNGGA